MELIDTVSSVFRLKLSGIGLGYQIQAQLTPELSSGTTYIITVPRHNRLQNCRQVQYTAELPSGTTGCRTGVNYNRLPNCSDNQAAELSLGTPYCTSVVRHNSLQNCRQVQHAARLLLRHSRLQNTSSIVVNQCPQLPPLTNLRRQFDLLPEY